MSGDDVLGDVSAKSTKLVSCSWCFGVVWDVSGSKVGELEIPRWGRGFLSQV